MGICPLGYREALHAASMLHDGVERFLCEHPCVVLDAAAFRMAQDAATALFNLYQRLGALEAASEAGAHSCENKY